MSPSLPPLIPGRRPPEGSDLFGRDSLVLSRAAAGQFGGSRVLVTGAAGTLGAAVVRRLIGLRPDRVFLLDLNAEGLEALAADLGRPADDLVVADIRDAAGLAEVVRALAPHVVVHVAGLDEDTELEAAAAAATNVLGTRNVAAAAAAAGAGVFVHVSSDEASHPGSALGLSKRLAELVVARLAMASAGESDAMRAMSVRVGPLLDGGAGLLQAIARHGLSGQPVQLAHPGATCPVLNAADAAGLVLEAAALRGPARTYVLDAGEHVSVVEFARYLAARVGLPAPEFSFTDPGSAPGGPVVRKTSHPRVWSLPPDEMDDEIAARLDELCNLVGSGADSGADSAVHEAMAAVLAAARPRTLTGPPGR